MQQCIPLSVCLCTQLWLCDIQNKTPLSTVYSFIDQFVESCDTSHAKCLSHITSLSEHSLEKARPRNVKQETQNCVLIRYTEHFSVPVLYNLQWPPLRRNFAYSKAVPESALYTLLVFRHENGTE